MDPRTEPEIRTYSKRRKINKFQPLNLRWDPVDPPLPAAAITPAAPVTVAAAAASTLSRSRTLAAIGVFGSDDTIYQGNSYKMLTHDLPITPAGRYSCRGEFRENLLLDVASPVINDLLQRFLREHAAETIEDTQKFSETDAPTPIPYPANTEVLKSLVLFIHSLLHPVCGQSDINDLLRLKSSEEKIAPIEWFLERQIGVCRHYALVGAALLTNLIDLYARQNPQVTDMAKHAVFRFRTEVLGTAHSVIIYESENARYLLDPGFEIAINLQAEPEAALAQVRKLYNGDGKERQTDRFVQEIVQTYDALSAQKSPTADQIRVR